MMEADQGEDGGAVEDPGGEDEEVGEFFESAGERHHAGENSLKN